MKTQSERPLSRAVAHRVSAIRVGAVATALFALACSSDTTAPKSSVVEPNPLDPPGVTFITQSDPQIVPVAAVPQSRPYPGTRIAGEATICKDQSSRAGTYTFTIRVVQAHINDLVASSVTLSPGECKIVYNRWSRNYGISPFSEITVTEVIPADSLYRVASIAVDDDPTGPRVVSTGQSATFSVNAYHGGYANFFNESSTAAPPPPPTPAIVDLKTLSTFAVLAGTTVTCVTGSAVGGDIGVSPGSAVTGFGPCTHSGVMHLADGPAAQAQIDLIGAYNNLAGLPCPNVIVGDLGGTVKPAGVYCSPSSIGITGELFLDGGGDPDATFVFQAGSTLTTATGAIITLINGAQAKNVFFQVGSSATLGTGSAIKGNILALASITINDNVTLIGRALARNGAVTLGTGDTITLP